jgi:hypothetical protein
MRRATKAQEPTRSCRFLGPGNGNKELCGRKCRRLKLEQKLKLAGLKVRIRRELLKNSQKDMNSWTALMNSPTNHGLSDTFIEDGHESPNRRPGSLHPVDWVNLHSVCMPLRMMKKYLYPTIKLSSCTFFVSEEEI